MEDTAAAPSPEDVRAQVRRIAASQRFAGAQSLTRFIDFTVKETVEGRGASLKEYLIGVDVFGRGEGFDPRIDPIVRVQAGKLRTRLKQYYETEGATDPLLIEYPKGGYVPIFHVRVVAPECSATTETPSEDKGTAAVRIWIRYAAIGTAAFLLATVAAWWFILRPRDETIPVALVRLTSHSGFTGQPAVSPDGRLLAFSSDRGGAGDANIWVQQMQGGEPVQLTRNQAPDMSPDFSPDGLHVAFRSWRDGGGIYVAPTIGGGAERRIAEGGFAPRYSPDGRFVAYAANGIRIVSAAGGESRSVSGKVSGANCPLWTPDGTSVLFLGSVTDEEFDWWAAPVAGAGSPHRTGVSGELRRRGLALDQNSCPADWLGREVVFTLKVERLGNLWRVPLDVGAWKVSGPAVQIVPGPGIDNARAVVRTAQPLRFVFARESRNSHLWGIPVEANEGTARGEMVQLTHDVSLVPGQEGTNPAISGDGKRLFYASSSSGNPDIWLTDLSSGREVNLTGDPQAEDRPLADWGGKKVVYRVSDGHKQSIYMLEMDKRNARKLCDDCGEPKDLSADGSLVLYRAGQPWGLSLLDTANGQTTELLRDGKNLLMEASFSSDAHWIALVVRSPDTDRHRGYVVPFAGRKLGDADSWIPITEEMFHLHIRWSPNGNLLYYFSVKDDSRCLWAQHLDPSTKRPVGEAVAVRHFHAVQHYPWLGSWLAVSSDKLVVNLSDINSEIWMATLR